MKGKNVHLAFLDLEKAYVRVDRNATLKVLMLYGIDSRLLEALKGFYVNSNAYVGVGNEVSDWFSVKSLKRRGCGCLNGNTT